MTYKSKLNQQPLQVSCRPVVRDRQHDQTNWLPALGFAFLTYNSFIAVYRSVGDPRTVAFVVVSYLDLLLLFLCLRLLDNTPEEEEEEDGGSASSSRGKLKAAVWALASLLTLMFSYRVAEIMPWPAAVAIWAMAAVTVCGGFWGFFIYQYQLQDHADVDGVIAKP